MVSLPDGNVADAEDDTFSGAVTDDKGTAGDAVIKESG